MEKKDSEEGGELMSLIDRWMQDHIFFHNDPETGKQYMFDTWTGEEKILTPEDPQWDPDFEMEYRELHPEAKNPK